jgi:hypothetical protein
MQIPQGKSANAYEMFGSVLANKGFTGQRTGRHATFTRNIYCASRIELTYSRVQITLVAGLQSGVELFDLSGSVAGRAYLQLIFST